jgi:DNA-binding NarL/FixJ family response regulator
MLSTTDHLLGAARSGGGGGGPPRASRAQATITVLIVHDHPAVPAAMASLLATGQNIDVVGATVNAGRTLTRVVSESPDVVLLDYIRHGEELMLARQLKHLRGAPKVIVYAPSAGGILTGAAIVAGADALLGSAPLAELGRLVRSVFEGERIFPGLTPASLNDLARRLLPEDRAILTMLIHHTAPDDIADVLGISARLLSARRGVVLEALSAAAEAERLARG